MTAHQIRAQIEDGRARTRFYALLDDLLEVGVIFTIGTHTDQRLYSPHLALAQSALTIYRSALGISPSPGADPKPIHQDIRLRALPTEKQPERHAPVDTAGQAEILEDTQPRDA
ncbi:hypothetical protein [Oerskovia sp. Root22]|uniref:hypothetical protein n=1 Tax=Oerskovia sp. Root22 TaxID=1736494 RepID=UPI00070148EF|nr:hypothetical protein [Oerskovia sp. Root22]KRC43005.1 hypothetical protein ASE15_03335 [Oerskovia sp. Root22]